MDSNIDLIIIRKATLADAALIAEFGAHVFSESYAAQNDPANMADYLSAAFSFEKQTAELLEPGSTFFIAEQNRQTVGYARLRNSPTPACMTGKQPVELVRMYSLASHIGRGIGGRLMQACLNEGRAGGYDSIWLSVWQKNPRAIAFYRKWGFEIAGETTFTIGDDVQSDWVMGRSLE